MISFFLGSCVSQIRSAATPDIVRRICRPRRIVSVRVNTYRDLLSNRDAQMDMLDDSHELSSSFDRSFSLFNVLKFKSMHIWSARVELARACERYIYIYMEVP